MAGGAVAAALLAAEGIRIRACTLEIGGIAAPGGPDFDPDGAALRPYCAPDAATAEAWEARMREVRGQGDTLGGLVRVEALGVPAGLGEPVFDKLDALLAHALMSVGAVKGVEVGDGFAAARSLGSVNNDPFLPLPSEAGLHDRPDSLPDPDSGQCFDSSRQSAVQAGAPASASPGFVMPSNHCGAFLAAFPRGRQSSLPWRSSPFPPLPWNSKAWTGKAGASVSAWGAARHLRHTPCGSSAGSHDRPDACGRSAHAAPASRRFVAGGRAAAGAVGMSQLKLPGTAPATDRVTVRGTLERVVFHNEENGYTVFRLRPEGRDDVDATAVVGYMASPQVGALLQVSGRWVNNPRFGRQIQMDAFESVLPATEEGIRLYLSSGLIKGIGKRIAERIVTAFGTDTLRIFDEEPERLLSVQGISPKKLAQIRECWQEHQGIRELVQFLQPHGIGIAFAVRIYKQYGARSLAIVRENPYRLAMDVHGVGFVTADALAVKLGFEKDHPLRAQAGTLYMLLQQVEDGHVYFPRKDLVELTSSKLDIAPDLVQAAVDQLVLEERAVLEDLDGEEGSISPVFTITSPKSPFICNAFSVRPRRCASAMWMPPWSAWWPGSASIWPRSS